MMEKLRAIDLLCLLISMIVLFIYFSKYVIHEKQVAQILEDLEVEKLLYKTVTAKCELIAHTNNLPIENYEFKSLLVKKNLFPLWYWDLKYTVDSIQNRFGRYTSSNGTIIDKYKFAKDNLSDEVFFGALEYSNIKCKQYELKINNKKYDSKTYGRYKIPAGENIKIEYLSYELDNNNIDTQRVTRYLALE